MALEHRHRHTHTYEWVYSFSQVSIDTHRVTSGRPNRPEILLVKSSTAEHGKSPAERAVWVSFNVGKWRGVATLPSLVTCRSVHGHTPTQQGTTLRDSPINNGNNCRSWKSDCYANRLVLMRKTQWAFKGLTKAMNGSIIIAAKRDRDEKNKTNKGFSLDRHSSRNKDLQCKRAIP